MKLKAASFLLRLTIAAACLAGYFQASGSSKLATEAPKLYQVDEFWKPDTCARAYFDATVLETNVASNFVAYPELAQAWFTQ